MPVALRSTPSQSCTRTKPSFLPWERIRLFSAHFAGTIVQPFESENRPYSDARMERCETLVEFFEYNLKKAESRGWGVKLARKLLREAFQMKSFGHYTRGELQESCKCMERAVELNPGSLMLRGMLDHVECLLHEEGEAIKTYQEDLQKRSGNEKFDLQPVIDRYRLYAIEKGHDRKGAIKWIYEMCLENIDEVKVGGRIANVEKGRMK